MMKKEKIGVGIIGFGTVGTGVAKVLLGQAGLLQRRLGAELELVGIADLDLKRDRGVRVPKKILTKDAHRLIEDPRIQIVVELIGGIHPAKEFILSAMAKGKHVVTANKALLAAHGEEIFEAAHRTGVDIGFEGSVGGGIPIIRVLREGLSANHIESIYGIINGTSNYILTKMTEEGKEFSDVLAEAKAAGYAEADPTLDVEGIDSAHKLAILIFLAFGKSVQMKDIYVEGITHISHVDIEHAESLGLTIKLLAIAKRANDQIEVRVQPTLISKEHPLASVNGIFNAVLIDTDPLGDILLYGQGAGQMAAASGVMSDLINLAARHKSSSTISVGNLFQDICNFRLRSIDEIKTKFYLRFMAIDKPGVLSKIAGILGRHGISIASVTQKMHRKSSAVPVVILTDYAKEKMLRLSLQQITRLSVVKSRPVAIRMEKL